MLIFSPGSNQYGSIQGHTSVTSGSLLDDDHWHSVVIERYKRNVNFTLDHHTQKFRTNGEFDHLDLDYEVDTFCWGNLGKPAKLSHTKQDMVMHGNKDDLKILFMGQ